MMKVRIIKTSVVYEFENSYAMRLIEQRKAVLVSGDVPVTPEPLPIEMDQYEVGPGRQFESLTECLIALKDDAREKTIDLYEGTYDVLAELGGQAFLDGITSKQTWYELCPIVPPNTTIVGHGRVEIKMELPKSNTRLAPLNLMGSAVLRNLRISCTNAYTCVRIDKRGSKYGNALWIIEDCVLTSPDIVLGDDSGRCVNATLYDGTILQMKNTQCMAGAGVLRGDALTLKTQIAKSRLTPRAYIEDCAIDGGVWLRSDATEENAAYTIADVWVENSYLRSTVTKGTLEEAVDPITGESVDFVDCFRVTYFNTPHTTDTRNIVSVIEDVSYDTLDRQSVLRYTAQTLTDARKAQARANIDCVGNIVCDTESVSQSVPAQLPGLIEDDGNTILVPGSADSHGIPYISDSENLLNYPYKLNRTSHNGMTFSTYYRWLKVSGVATASASVNIHNGYIAIPSAIKPGDTIRIKVIPNKALPVNTAIFDIQFANASGSTVGSTCRAYMKDSFEKLFVVPDNAAKWKMTFQCYASAAEWEDVALYPIILLNSAQFIALADAEIPVGTSVSLPLANYAAWQRINTFQYGHLYRYKIKAKTYIDNHVSEVKMTYVTPEQFGAVGDGIADDTAALQACIDHACANNVPARAMQRYLASAPLVVGSGVDLQINRLDYTGTDAAILMDCAQSRVDVRRLNSNGVGVKLYGKTVSAVHNDIKLGFVSSKSHCVHIEAEVKSVYANKLEFDLLQAGGDGCNCIFNSPDSVTFVTENSFTGGQCSNADWAYYGGGGNSKFYNFQVEGKIKGGYCFTGGAATVIGDRHAESERDGEYPYLKVTGLGTYPTSEGAGMVNAIRYISAEGLRANEIDISEVPVQSYDEGQGYKTITSAGRLGKLDCAIQTAYVSGTDTAKHFQRFADSALMWCNMLILQGVPEKYHVVTENLDLRTITEDTPAMPTVFEIGCANCEIHLHPSYCFMGISRFRVIQTEEYQAKIYDYFKNSPVFDGSSYGAGTYEVYTYINGDHARTDGTNMVWKVRRIALTVDADGNATI